MRSTPNFLAAQCAARFRSCRREGKIRILPHVSLLLLLLVVPTTARGQEKYHTKQTEKHKFAYEADEPIAKRFSYGKAAEYLDNVGKFWMKAKSCGDCHADLAYMVARPKLKMSAGSVVAETRNYLENWDSLPRYFRSSRKYLPAAHAVSKAFALAWDDAHNGGKLQPATRKALKRMWGRQQSRGTWDEFGCSGFPPAESDGYYTTFLAALAVGVAPDDYAKSEEIQEGMKKMKAFFSRIRLGGLDLHHRAMLLWISLHLDDVMSQRVRNATISALLAKQRPDGGWSFSAMRPERGVRQNGKSTAVSPSDGYGTAFAIYILRQAGVSSSRAEVVRGVRWLKQNQRISGRWFTPTPDANQKPESGFGTRGLYIQYVGTAFAVLALKSCEE